MLDHISLPVSDIATARAFFEAALKPLGYAVAREYPGALGFRDNNGGMPLWIVGGAKATPSLHIAFAAKDRAEVDHFYAAAMGVGGRDNGKPGLRPQYHASYYGAFVYDPDGNNIEVVCHKDE